MSVDDAEKKRLQDMGWSLCLSEKECEKEWGGYKDQVRNYLQTEWEKIHYTRMVEYNVENIQQTVFAVLTWWHGRYDLREIVTQNDPRFTKWLLKQFKQHKMKWLEEQVNAEDDWSLKVDPPDNKPLPPRTTLHF